MLDAGCARLGDWVPDVLDWVSGCLEGMRGSSVQDAGCARLGDWKTV